MKYRGNSVPSSINNRILTKEALSDLPDFSHLECDGRTRIVSFLLQKKNIPHVIKVGHVLFEGKIAIPYHMWIETDAEMVDFALNMWIETETGQRIRDGILPLDEIDGRIKYVADETKNPKEIGVNAMVYAILIDRSHIEAFERLRQSMK